MKREQLRHSEKKNHTRRDEINRETKKERKNIMEEIRKSLQPYITWGIITLSTYSILNLEKEKEEKTNFYSEKTVEGRLNDKTGKERLIIDGPVYDPVKREIERIYGINARGLLWLDGSDRDFKNFLFEVEKNRKAFDDIILSKRLLKLPKEITKIDANSILENPQKYIEVIVEIIREKYNQLVKRSREERRQFRYYNKKLFKNYDSFKRIVTQDKTFRKNIIQEYKAEHITENPIPYPHYMNSEDFERYINSFIKNDYEFFHSKEFMKLTDREKGELKKNTEKNYGKEITHILINSKSWDDAKKRITLEQLFNHLIEPIIRETFHKIQRNMRKYDEAIKKRIGMMKNSKYLERLAKELNGDIEKAEEVQKKMISNIEDRDYYLSNFPHNTLEHAAGHSSPEGYVVSGYDESEETILHEYSHRADKNGEMIPDDGKKKLKEHYKFKKHQTDKEKKFEAKYSNKFEREYYSNPSEILARKAVFDVKLEELGIKKYEEEFTEKHYRKVKKLLEEGKLDKDSSQFFRMFEKDALIMIMNTIAYKDWKEKGVPIDQGKLAEELVAKIMRVDELNKKGDTYHPPEFWVNSDTEVS